MNADSDKSVAAKKAEDVKEAKTVKDSKKAESTKSKVAKDKKPKEKKEPSDGKRHTIWLSDALRKEVLKKFPDGSFSGCVEEGLKLLLKKG